MSSLRYILGGRACGKVARLLRLWADKLAGPAVRPEPPARVYLANGKTAERVTLRAQETVKLYGSEARDNRLTVAVRGYLASELARHAQDCVIWDERNYHTEHEINGTLIVYKPTEA